MKIIPVTCAIIYHQEKVLAAQRSEAMDLPGKWEFPGGKVEEGENPKDCLLREIKEELSLEIEIFESLSPTHFSYPSKAIELLPFAATWKSGELLLAEHAQIRWLDKKELFTVDWAEADLPIVHELLRKWVKLVAKLNPQPNGS